MRRAGWILLITCLGYCADNAQRPLPHCSLPTWLPHCSCVVVAVCGSSLALAAALIMRSSAFALATDTICPRLASSRQRFLPHLHANHHRNLWLRSHPPHLASPAPCSPLFQPQSNQMRRLTPPHPPLALVVVSTPPVLQDKQSSEHTIDLG